MDNMFEQSRKRGFRRPAVIFCGFPVTAQIRKKFERNCSLDPEKFCRSLTPEMEVEDQPYRWTGDLYKILHQFAGMPKNVRPDVLLIPDDVITSVAHRELLKMQLNGCDWNPFFIYQTTRQMPILPDGSIRGDYYEYDTMLQAEAAVKLLLDVISGKETGERTVYIEPILHETEGKL